MELSAATPNALEALGLCSLAVGDANAALHAWKRAYGLNKDARLQEWIDSLVAGDIRDALVSYNKALACAKANQHKDALQFINLSLEKLAGFQPALELRDVVLTALQVLEQIPDTHVSSRHLRRPRVLMVVATVVVGMFLVGAVRYGIKVRAPTVPAPIPTSHEPPSSTVLGLALQGESDSLADLIRSVRLSEHQWNLVAERKADSILWSAGWRHYRIGMNAFRASSLEAANSELRTAARYGRGSFYEDDALYMLSKVLVQMNDSVSARPVARDIMERFPRSIFANSRTRRLAAQGN